MAGDEGRSARVLHEPSAAEAAKGYQPAVEATGMLGVKRASLQYHFSRGALYSRRVSGRVYVNEADVVALSERRKWRRKRLVRRD